MVGIFSCAKALVFLGDDEIGRYFLWYAKISWYFFCLFEVRAGSELL